MRSGAVLVDGLPVRNPRSLVRRDAKVEIVPTRPPLRGEAKLRAALDAFGVAVDGAVALDLGAAAGGFTRVLLDEGAARVYAVDAGFGQLLGSLRQHPRVVVLERTNLGDLDSTLVPCTVDVVTADLSYVSLAVAIPQLEGRVAFQPDATLLALVKPQFELARAEAPTARDALDEAARRAADGIASAGWEVVGTADSPVRGAGGAAELLLHARRKR